MSFIPEWGDVLRAGDCILIDLPSGCRVLLRNTMLDDGRGSLTATFIDDASQSDYAQLERIVGDLMESIGMISTGPSQKWKGLDECARLNRKILGGGQG